MHKVKQSQVEYLSEVMEKFVPLNGSEIPLNGNTKNICEDILLNPNTICIMSEGKGVILGIVYPNFWNPGVLIAQELGWWVEPEHRNTSLSIRLLKRFEQEAKKRGAQQIHMIALEAIAPDMVGKIYMKQGYKPLEHTYMKGT